VQEFIVANMPSRLPKQVSLALERQKLVYLPALLTGMVAGYGEAVRHFPELGRGFNVLDGAVTCKPVANQHGHAFTQLRALLRPSAKRASACRTSTPGRVGSRAARSGRAARER
jgi:alanine dehydrogenase